MNNISKRQSSKLLVMMLAVVMVLAMMPSMIFAADFDNDHDRISIATGEPLTIQWPSSTATTGAAVPDNSSYYPNTFTLYVQNGTPTISEGTATVEYAYDAADNNKAYTVNLTTAATIKVVLNGTTNATYYVTCEAPRGAKPTAVLPTAVNGYLPIGQFASGSGWGSLFSDGTNLTGTNKKFLSGYSGTGVSLGAAGGYVDMDLRVSNDSTNPYGVDFIVYGNAFNGNPEAASVKVFGYKGKADTDGAWYELAGSLYFNDVTQRNKDLSYKKVDGEGIYYQYTDHGVAPTDSGWKKFNSNTSVAWWPEDTEGYNNVWGPVDDVTKTDNVITYKNVNLVKDTDTTNDYQFGYADVHVNGSNYGTAVNPYTATNTTQGGDGFDLAWAVDSDGNVVKLDHITKVRVYTSAAMKSDGSGDFTVPGIFGETSAEVCGVYGVNGKGSGATKAKPSIKNGSETITTTNLGTTTTSVNAGTYTFNISSSEDNVYVNGVKVSSPYAYTVTVAANQTKYMQVITQSGDKSPYVTMVKIVGK